MLVWNSKFKSEQRQLTIGSENTTIKANANNKESRYLGIYLRSKAGDSHVINRIQLEITTMCNILMHKRLTAAQLVYINNKVLLARIEYWAKTTSKCKKLHNRFIQLIKRSMRVVSSANNNIFNHQGLVGATAMHQHLRTAQFTEFIIRKLQRPG